MPNTPEKHAANFYLRRDLTARVRRVAEAMDVSSSSVVAMCLVAGLPTLEYMEGKISDNAKRELSKEPGR